jgi:hypothetical protein
MLVRWTRACAPSRDRGAVRGRDEAHPGLLVEDLETARRALAAGGAPVVEDSSGLAIRRCYTADPFGNRVELIDARDAGLSSGVEEGR